MFFDEIKGLTYKNSYSPSVYMVKTFENQEKPLQTSNNDSIILRFILALTKYNLDKAKDILGKFRSEVYFCQNRFLLLR